MKLLSLLISIAAAAGSQAATQSLKPETSIETRHLRATISTSPPEAAAGTKLSLFVDISPKPNMHVYAPGQKDYITVALSLDKDDRITAGPPKFPPPEKLFFEPLQETQLVYSHPFRIVQPISIVQPPRDETLTLKGTLRYQACDDAVCYIPATVPLTWSVKLKSPSK
jgi:DsbC/DsbD-like thiol-disulfide interchange protein